MGLRKLKPGDKCTEHGITFDRLANGDGRYTVNIMVDGIRVHRVIGKESEGVTRENAEDFIKQARTEARQDRLNLPKGRKMVLGFAQAAQIYLDKIVQEGGKDIEKKRYRLERHLVPFFTHKSLAKVRTFDVQRYKKQRLEASAAPGSINRELAALSHLFTKAVEWQWIDVRPASIERLKEDRGRITYLTTDQIALLLDAAGVDQNFQIYPFILIALETSMRRMEILSHPPGAYRPSAAGHLPPPGEGRCAGTTNDSLPGGVLKNVYRNSRVWARMVISLTHQEGSHEMDRRTLPSCRSARGFGPQGSCPAHATPYRDHSLSPSRGGSADRTANLRPQDTTNGSALQPSKQ